MLATGEIGRGLFEEVDFGRDTGLFLAAFDCFFITMGGMLLSCIWIKGDGGMVSSLKCPVFKPCLGYFTFESCCIRFDSKSMFRRNIE